MNRTLEAAIFFALLLVAWHRGSCRARIWSPVLLRPRPVSRVTYWGRRGWHSRVGELFSSRCAVGSAATSLGRDGLPLGSSPPFKGVSTTPLGWVATGFQTLPRGLLGAAVAAVGLAHTEPLCFFVVVMGTLLS